MADESPIRVLIVEDHPVTRIGIENVLGQFSDMEVVGAAEDVEEAIQKCAAFCPDVVLCDLLLGGRSSIEAIRHIRVSHPEIQVVAFTGNNSQKLLHDALHAGAIAFLKKEVAPDEIASAIRMAFEGKPSLGSEAIRSVMEMVARAPRFDQHPTKLTPREKEILALILIGLGNKEISFQLGVSLSTVKKHINNMLTKLGVTTRIEAALKAQELDLLSKADAKKI